MGGAFFAILWACHPCSTAPPARTVICSCLSPAPNCRRTYQSVRPSMKPLYVHLLMCHGCYQVILKTGQYISALYAGGGRGRSWLCLWMMLVEYWAITRVRIRLVDMMKEVSADKHLPEVHPSRHINQKQWRALQRRGSEMDSQLGRIPRFPKAARLHCFSLASHQMYFLNSYDLGRIYLTLSWIKFKSLPTANMKGWTATEEQQFFIVYNNSISI